MSTRDIVPRMVALRVCQQAVDASEGAVVGRQWQLPQLRADVERLTFEREHYRELYPRTLEQCRANPERSWSLSKVSTAPRRATPLPSTSATPTAALRCTATERSPPCAAAGPSSSMCRRPTFGISAILLSPVSAGCRLQRRQPHRPRQCPSGNRDGQLDHHLHNTFGHNEGGRHTVDRELWNLFTC
jgi:hypothetical protein